MHPKRFTTAALTMALALALVAPALAANAPVVRNSAGQAVGAAPTICVTPAGEFCDPSAVSLSGGNFVLAPTLTVDASAYAAGEALTDLITVTGAARTAGGSGLVDSIDIVSTGGSTNAIHVYVWDKLPTATCTKNAAFAPAAADNAYRLPGFPQAATLATSGLATDTRTRIQLNGFAANFDNQDTTPGTAIYVCLVTGAIVTPGSTADLSMIIGGIRD